jgi:hypothetical protein
MSLALENNVQMIYGIYFGKIEQGYVGPDGERQAGCVITENQSDEEIIANLVASDFLSQWNQYTVIHNGPSIHIYYKLEGRVGGIALILMYEEDMEQISVKKTAIEEVQIYERENKMSNLDKEMREWLLGCFDDEYDQEQINSLSHEQLVRAINRYYDGGIRSFLSVLN